MPAPVNWTTSPIFVEIPAVTILNLALPLPLPIMVWSKKSASPVPYPEPREIISAEVTELAAPETVTLAVAPFQVPLVGSELVFNSLTL